MNNSNPDFLKLVKLCKKVYLRAKELIPFSANKPSLYDPAPRKDLLLMLVRINNPLLHKYKELFNRLHLFLGEDKVSKDFYETKLSGTFNGLVNPSMGELSSQIQSIHSTYKSQHKDGTSYEKKHAVERSAKKAIQFGVGNCGEHADLVYSLLLEYKNNALIRQKVRIEKMLCSLGDHGFVVVNRNKNSTVTDLSTWGPGALIIDTWDGDIMYATTGISVLNSKIPRYYDYYNYIKTHAPQVETSGFIGEGLSERFIKHAKEKNRPHRFFDWPAKYTGHKRTDKKKELTHIPIDLQDEPILTNKRKNDEVDIAYFPHKKVRFTNPY